jgi:tetrapyrrole methylase family protein/MazG family protein
VQTHDSIRRNFLEETYECCEAIDNDDLELMKEELGDVMMQVIFHAGIEQDRGRFDLDDVCDGAVKKLVFRHPNVFGPKTAQTWDDMKALEKGQKTQTATLDAVSRSLPALWRADKLVTKSEKAGFRWADAAQALEKLQEEVGELSQAVEEGSNIEEELGDVLFAAVCAAVKAEIDPEMALHSACEKFIRRFSAMEQAAETQGRSLHAYTSAEQLALWQDAKQREA